MLRGKATYTKEGLRTVIPMDDDHRVWVLVIILGFIIVMSFIGWQWFNSSQHAKNLEQHRIAVEVCMNSVESDLAKVDCLRSNAAISAELSATN